MAEFGKATAVARSNNGYQASLDPDWFIWGPFGGYLAAIAMRAMAAHSARRRPATFSCQYLNVGVAGPVEVEVRHLKTGRRAECLGASICQGDKTLIEAQSWIVEETLSGLEHESQTMPLVDAPSSLPDWEGFGGEEEKSGVWRHMSRKPLKGSRQFARGLGEPRWSCWVRLNEPLPADDPALQAARAILWMDMAPWNAALVVHERPTAYIAPTLDLAVQFQPDLCAVDAGASDWMLVRTDSPVAARGLFGAQTKLWSASGKLIAVGAMQGLCVPNPRHSRSAGRHV